MSPKQVEQFNRMRAALLIIAKSYKAPDKLRESAQKMYGLDGDEAVDMAYENIQQEAANAVRGVRALKATP